MLKNCTQCKTQFEITDEDLQFYDKISPTFVGKKFQVPPPKLCPDCRQQRRLSFRNVSKLYNRKSDLTGKQIISMHSPNKPYKVYDQSEWWSDKWNALDYGRDFDFSKTLAEQLKDLYQDVPHVSLNNINVENSYFTNFALNQKNSYLIFGGGDDEDCMFGKYVVKSKNCVDSYSLFSSELCYEGVASDNCYSCRFFINSRNCSDCLMIEECQSCKNCIGCFGLRQKEYYVFNEYLGKEKYQQFAQQFKNISHAQTDLLNKKLTEIKNKLPHVQSHIYASENCSGDGVFNSKNCHFAFDAKECENCKFIYSTPKSTNTYDSTYNAPEGNEFCYNICSTVGLNQSMFTFYVWYGNDIYYSIECHHNKNLFACVGLRNQEYCILNKKYSKEEYEKLVAKIIEHMQKNGEWGEYFSFELSPFGYNETIAQEYYPLNKEAAEKIGAKWYQEEPSSKYEGKKIKIPETINQVTEEVLKEILTCDNCNKNYKIIAQELKFYRQMGVPIPLLCFDCRHQRRLQLRNPFKLYTRNCVKCGTAMQTTYSPDLPETIYCESCYLKEVY